MVHRVQMHSRCTPYCLRDGRCRFGYPQPLCQATRLVATGDMPPSAVTRSDGTAARVQYDTIDLDGLPFAVREQITELEERVAALALELHAAGERQGEGQGGMEGGAEGEADDEGEGDVRDPGLAARVPPAFQLDVQRAVELLDQTARQIADHHREARGTNTGAPPTVEAMQQLEAQLQALVRAGRPEEESANKPHSKTKWKLEMKRDNPHCNAYAAQLLWYWMANVDVTLVTSAFAAVCYITKYITKVEANTIPSMLKTVAKWMERQESEQQEREQQNPEAPAATARESAAAHKRLLLRLLMNAQSDRQYGVHEAIMILLGEQQRFVYPRVHDVFVSEGGPSRTGRTTITSEDRIELNVSVFEDEYPNRPRELSHLSAFEYLTSWEAVKKNARMPRRVAQHAKPFLDAYERSATHLARPLQTPRLVNLAPSIRKDFRDDPRQMLRMLLFCREEKRNTSLTARTEVILVEGLDCVVQV
eukprot:TRINITY_DN2778_c0_g2_i1.p1 TRINITY_DN2778_c0_g2~~TRINITY_DN2778_c0_g2_i1.p1  ORF type:complete len:493 (+),score=124.49 TRINITY_DN2778_c0_g2_i1:48-1481(+)